MAANINQLDRFINEYRGIDRVLIKDVVWDFPDEQEGFLRQYEQLAVDGINYKTPRFGDFGVMSDAYEHHTGNILEWARQHASKLGFESLEDYLLEKMKEVTSTPLSTKQISAALSDKHSDYYYDVTTLLMMELSHQVCLHFMQYVQDDSENQ